MLFGKDFEKISITIGNYHILEPNVFITDAIMAGVSLLLSFYIVKMRSKTEFSHYWFLFFFVYGISSFVGGLGHALFYYFGVPGKFFTWITGILSIYFIERAIIGVILSAGILGYRFSKSIHIDFKYFYYGVLIMVPSAVIFLAKINPHPWFDKNDLSHVLLTIGIIYFYIGIEKTKNLVR